MSLLATVTVPSRLHTADQFKNIIRRTGSDGADVHLSDVARSLMKAGWGDLDE